MLSLNASRDAQISASLQDCSWSCVSQSWAAGLYGSRLLVVEFCSSPIQLFASLQTSQQTTRPGSRLCLTAPVLWPVGLKDVRALWAMNRLGAA